MRASLLLVVLGVAGAAHAAKGLPPPSKLTLVQAQCAGPPAGPCSTTFTFTSGTAILKSEKEPGPTCPKTGNPSDSVGGTIRLVGVAKGGAPFSGTLNAEVDYTATFGTDPNGNCVLAGIHLTAPSLTATLTCRAGRCKGTLIPVACLPKNCADVRIITELSSLFVFDDTGTTLLATPGTFVTPAAGDAP